MTTLLTHDHDLVKILEDCHADLGFSAMPRYMEKFGRLAKTHQRLERLAMIVRIHASHAKTLLRS